MTTNKRYTPILGTTNPLDSVKYSVIEASFVISDITTPYPNSYWSSDSNQRLFERVRHSKTPYGTLGALIGATPIMRISKVFIEDMLFLTWSHDRAVLIRDVNFLPCSRSLIYKHRASSKHGYGSRQRDAVYAVVHSSYIYDITDITHVIYKNFQATSNDYRQDRFLTLRHSTLSLNSAPGFNMAMYFLYFVRFVPLWYNGARSRTLDYAATG
ncbi:MAG: hypothetical protein JOS17DRAFT_795315 [Linnemannia elongata]|nr:MAG: hypothetical protein JOS17DRAFT_795315 [Linnemannia elongata]